MLAKIRKALVAALGALLTGVVAAVVQAGGMPGVIDLLPVLLGAVAVGYGTWRVTNAPAAPAPVAPASPAPPPTPPAA